jgi:hypothetical protein
MRPNALARTACTALMCCASLMACAARGPERIAQDAQLAASERTPEKLLERGLGFAQIGDLTRAEQYLVAALDAGAPAETVLPKLLIVCIAATHYRAGIDYAAPELRRNPDNAHLRLVVAELETLTGDAGAARVDFDKVTTALPYEPAPHFAFGRLLRDRFDDRVGADKEFRAYLTLEPHGEHANEARGSLLKSIDEAPPILRTIGTPVPAEEHKTE